LWMEVYNSLHLSYDTVYYWLHALCSGHNGTVFINSIYNLFALMFCYASLHTLGIDGLKDFDDDVLPIVYGDDNVAAISDRALEWYNQNTISAAMINLNLEYTTENKKQDCTVANYRSLEEVSFLKRNFRFHKEKGLFIAPLELRVILEMPYWTKKGIHEITIQMDNVENALQELSLHPREIFNEWAPHIIRNSQELLDFTPPVVSQNALLRASMARDDAW
jgi:hypothetical protein